MALQPFLSWILAAFEFLDLIQSRYDSLDGGSARRKAATCTHRTARTKNKRTQKSMTQMGFEPMIRVFERAKTIHALDRATTVIGLLQIIWTDPVAGRFCDLRHFSAGASFCIFYLLST
jgi:hypothetical protein